MTGTLNQYRLGRNLAARGAFGSLRKAAARFARATELDPGYAQAWIGVARTPAEMVSTGSMNPGEYVAFAEVPVATLEQAVDSGWNYYWPWVLSSPNLDSLRDDPRFRAVVARLKASMGTQLQAIREQPDKGERDLRQTRDRAASRAREYDSQFGKGMSVLRMISGPLATALFALPLYCHGLEQTEAPADVPRVDEARTRPTPGEDAVVRVEQEPRHHLVYQGDGFQVLDIGFPPGDTTLFHLHDAPMFYVSVSASTTDAQVLGGEWLGARAFEAPAWHPGEVDSNTTYAELPVIHRVKNVGDNPFRLIGVTNKRTRPENTTLEDRLPGEPEIQNAWFGQSRARVAPGESTFIQPLSRPVVLVQASPGSARIRLAGRDHKGMDSTGDFVVVEPGQELELVNAGDSPLTVVFIAVH